MQRSGPNVALVALAGLLLLVLYPALVLDQRLAPEASLKSEPPWRLQSGPYPNPSPLALAAATRLGPRLACIARDGLRVALWNPWIGAGRPGWLSSPEEGGAPLVVIAGLLARPGWAWTSLLALQVSASFLGTLWVLRGLGCTGWPAAVGATAYALSGPVSGLWLDWRGSAHALGPLALAPVLFPPRTLGRRVASWATVLAVLLACGAPAIPFIALALAALIASRPLLGHGPRFAPPALAAVVTAALLLAPLWLQRSGGEPGAPAESARTAPAPVTLKALVTPQAASETGNAGAASSSEAEPPYLGTVTLLLALVGVVGLGFRARGFWLGVVIVTVLLAALPTPALARAGIAQRPLGVLALAAAILAAHGAAAVCRRLSSESQRATAGLAIWILVVIALAPAAAGRLPYASAEDTELPLPVSASLAASPMRLVGILGMLPPDVSATLGLADVRASSFRGEPRYASLLRPDRDGEVSVSRALDIRTARLGARWLLEPLPLRVVSGEIFAGIEVSRIQPRDDPPLDGLHRYRVEVPRGACRLGLAAGPQPSGAWLERPGRRAQLEADAALTAESDNWRWYAVPEEWPTGPATLAVPELPDPDDGRHIVAWDVSGLRVAHEEHGARVWAWDRARPFAFVASGLEAEGSQVPTDATTVTVEPATVGDLGPLTGGAAGARVEVVGATPSRVEILAETAAPALLVVQLKFRPALWKTQVNGHSAVPHRADGVWTALALPAGRSRVVMRAGLPLPVWLVSSGGIVALGVLVLTRRKR